MLSRTVKDLRYGVSDWKGRGGQAQDAARPRGRAGRGGAGSEMSYPVGVSGVGAGEDVQQVVAVSGYQAAGLVVQSAVGSAAGPFVTLVEQREQVTLR